MSQAPTKRPQPPSFKGQIITLAFPVLGIDVSCALEKQTPMTTAFGTNVRGWEQASGRNRGGARPGLSQYIPQQLPGGASEVQMLQVVVDPQAIALPFVSGPLADPNGAIYGDGTPITYPTQGTGFQQENVNINPAKITITANNQSIIFGSALELEGTEFSVSGSLGILDKVTSVQFAINLVPVGLGQPLVVNVPLGVPYVPPTTLLLPANSGLTYQLIPHNAVVTGPAGGKATYNISYNNGGLTVQGLISFTTQPSNLSVGSNGSASVLVTDDSDNPLEGVSVAISLLNQKTGVLTGTLTATTDDTGTAAFTNWQVTKSGTYQLVAQFNVSLPPNWPYDGPVANSDQFNAASALHLVQETSQIYNTAGFTNPITAGNLIVVVESQGAFGEAGGNPPYATPTSLTDSLGNEYQKVQGVAASGGPDDTINFTSSVESSVWWCISDFSGECELTFEPVGAAPFYGAYLLTGFEFANAANVSVDSSDADAGYSKLPFCTCCSCRTATAPFSVSIDVSGSDELVILVAAVQNSYFYTFFPVPCLPELDPKLCCCINPFPPFGSFYPVNAGTFDYAGTFVLPENTYCNFAIVAVAFNVK